MLELVAVIVRLLPAVVAMLAVTIWAIVITPILLIVWIVSVPLFLIAVPLKFIGAALGGDLYYFKQEVAEAMRRWKTGPDRHGANVMFAYQSVFNWLMGEPPPKSPHE